MRANINLYKAGKGKGRGAAAAKAKAEADAAAGGSEAVDGDDGTGMVDGNENDSDNDEDDDEEGVKLDELLDEMTLSLSNADNSTTAATAADTTNANASGSGGPRNGNEAIITADDSRILTAEEAAAASTFNVATSGFDAADYSAKDFKFT
jgi:hypothetical protein